MRKPSDFATREEALAYANARLDELNENIRETSRELEEIWSSLMRGPLPERHEDRDQVARVGNRIPEVET